MNTTRLLAVYCCLALLVAPAGAHPGHGDGDAHDYALLVDGSVTPSALPVEFGVGQPAATPVSAIVGALRDETLSATVRAPADGAARLELRDVDGRVLATPRVVDGVADVGLDPLAPGVYVLALSDGQGRERDAVAVVVSGLGVSHTAVDRADAATAVPVQVTVYGPPSTVGRVDVVLANDATATVVPATSVRTGLHAATLRLDVPPGSYRLFAVVRDADGAVAAVTGASEFEVYTAEGTRADAGTATPSGSAAPTGTSIPSGTPDDQSTGGDATEEPEPAATDDLDRAGVQIPVRASLPVIAGLAGLLVGLVLAGSFVRRER